MTVLDSITLLRNDLDRTIESLEALRTGFALYAQIAPDLDKPRKSFVPAKAGERLQKFLSTMTETRKGAYVRVSALRKAYLRWCVLTSTPAVPPGRSADAWPRAASSTRARAGSADARRAPGKMSR